MRRTFVYTLTILTSFGLVSTSCRPSFGQQPSVASTQTALALPGGSVYVGEGLAFVAVITSTAPVSGGQVVFLDGTNVIATTPVSAGIAGVSIAGLSQGTHQISATFSGSSTTASSTSLSAPLVILPVAATPTVTCSSSPSSINQGDSAVITAVGSSPSGLPITISFTSSAGSLTANGSSATLNSTGVASGAVQITCTATDNLGHVGSATTSVFINSGQGQQALSAFSFPDSVGVNVHLHYSNTPYVTNFPGLFNAMVALGIHHYRNGIDPYAYSFEYANAEALGQAGIKADWNIDRLDTPQNINAIYANAPDSIDAFEGPNEDNQDAGPVLTAFMATLNATVRGNPNTATVPIYNETMTDINLVGTQGDLSAYVNDGNMHDYYYPRYPETPSYGGAFFGCGYYGSMPFNICIAQLNAVGLPVVSTETGYISGTQTDEVLGKYITRILFQHLALNVMRTYIYEFVEDVNSPGYGLMQADFTPKPAYTAIQNLISLFADQNFTTPGKLDYSLSGQTANLEHVLFQKKDGTYMLALWLGVASANPVSPYQTYSIPPQSVTVTSNTPVGAITLSTLDDEGNLTSQPAATGNPITVSVTDGITVVSMAPAQ